MFPLTKQLNPVTVTCLCRNFSATMYLAKQKDKERRFNILMAVKERRMKLKMRMTRKHPFNPNVYPVTAKHVGPKKLGGSEAIQEKVALHGRVFTEFRKNAPDTWFQSSMQLIWGC